jgi:hypothetical protein
LYHKSGETSPADYSAGEPAITYLSSAIGDVQLDMWYDDRFGWTGLGSTKGALVRHDGQG